MPMHNFNCFEYHIPTVYAWIRIEMNVSSSFFFVVVRCPQEIAHEYANTILSIGVKVGREFPL